MIALALDLGLALGLLALALHVATTRDDQAAILGFIAFGLLLGLGWIRLASVDVALTEAAIGGGATGMLLLRAHARMKRAPAPTRTVNTLGRSATALGCALIALGLAYAVLRLPDQAPGLAQPAMAAIQRTGLGNPVTAVLLAYRALDTLLEKIVIILALAGVWSLAPDRFWGGAPVLRRGEAPEPLVFLARALPPFGVLIGLYMLWVGADHPGGTFQAGSVLAAMWLLVMLAGLRREPETRSTGLRLVLVGGPALFIAIGVLGFATGGGFLAYPEGFAKPLIVVIEIGLALSVAAVLALMVAGPPGKAPAPRAPTP